ncbi:MAG: LysR substrate-binding domain-containing protein [Lachnospiraceae bacterium]
MKRETKRIADNDHATLRVGFYKGYHGNELSEAVAEFSSKYPTVEVSIMVGSHEELYRAMENDTVDLVLNDQRRAFSDIYNNKILSGSHMYIEISNRNPLSRLDMIEISELKNTPCILVMNPAGQQEEQTYYEDIIGIKGDYLFAV